MLARLPWWLLAPLVGLCACEGGSHEPPAPVQATVADRIAFDRHILVDQFGYLPDESKVAVIRDPIVGFDAKDRFTPGPRYQLRRVDTGEALLTGSPAAWNGGAVDDLSGDRGWWFDFTAVRTPGLYFVYDESRKLRSATFRIDPGVYRGVLQAAMHMYYYQRSAIPKAPPYADKCWSDDAAYVGRHQDGEARDVTDRDNDGKVKNLSGGWFDAGDTNKYVTFAVQPVHQLLTAYSANPHAFTDASSIPESGNGVPDVLDEVRWETNWLKKMQYRDGSLALKVGELTYVSASPPSSDRSPRFYVPACTSATIAGAGMLAHAAYVFAGFPPLALEAGDLKRRAVLAWGQYQTVAPKQTACDTGVVHAGLADLSVEDQNGLAVEAAVYLFALTAEPAFERYVQEHYRDAHPYHDIGWSRYKPDQGEALLFYAALPFADRTLARTILADKMSDMKAADRIYGFAPEDDLYRAFLHKEQYHWGSNNPRANYGNTNLDVIAHDLAPADAAGYRSRALGMLHYFHGVNPLGIVYLSNMYRYGASASLNEIYHVWFAAKSRWSDAKTSPCGPAPGFVPGGPNAVAAKDGVPASLVPPTGQPPQKSYKDWNNASPDNSWAVTEPGIYYQSAYVRLLSAFVP
ncbi:MAG: glycoside hydrolase family 9 protein [Pseudomonadota bacterium]|nr:glycoside hydrolase family 9 protein [Pseudomonadota bacterium]